MSDRIRVLRVIARLNIGGPAIHATLLTERLDPARYESIRLAGAEDPSEGNYLALCGMVSSGFRSCPRWGARSGGSMTCPRWGRSTP